VQLVRINVVASDALVEPGRDQGSDASALDVLSDGVEAVIYDRRLKEMPRKVRESGTGIHRYEVYRCAWFCYNNPGGGLCG